MLNFLGNDGGSNLTQWIFPGVLLAMIVLLFVMNYIRSKKDGERAREIASMFKPGDKVRTGHGIYGKIIEINETTYGKVVLLETGEGDCKGYVWVDLVAIAGLDEKKAIIYDLEGNPIVEGEEPEAAPASDAAEVAQVETSAEVVVEEVAVEEAVEEQPVATEKPKLQKPRAAKNSQSSKKK